MDKQKGHLGQCTGPLANATAKEHLEPISSNQVLANVVGQFLNGDNAIVGRRNVSFSPNYGIDGDGNGRWLPPPFSHFPGGSGWVRAKRKATSFPLLKASMKKAWGRSNKKASSGHLRRLIVASASRVSGNPSNVHSSATSQKTREDCKEIGQQVGST